MIVSSHQSQVPSLVQKYIDGVAVDSTFGIHPIVSQIFIPDRGWKRYPIRKRVSRSWARKAKLEGVTDVQLSWGRHLADFRIKELMG